MAASRVQYVHSELSASASTIAQAITVTGGNDLVISAGNFGGTSLAVTGVQDDLGNVGIVCAVSQYVPNFHLEIWFIENVTGGARTITVTFSGAHANRHIGVAEVSGLDTAPLDKFTNKDTQDSTNPNTNGVTTTTDGQYCFGVAVATPGTSLTATSPYADVVAAFPDANAAGLIGIEDQVQTAAGATNAAWTAVNSSWCAALATFKAAGAVPPAWGNMPMVMARKSA